VCNTSDCPRSGRSYSSVLASSFAASLRVFRPPAMTVLPQCPAIRQSCGAPHTDQDDRYKEWVCTRASDVCETRGRQRTHLSAQTSLPVREPPQRRERVLSKGMRPNGDTLPDSRCNTGIHTNRRTALHSDSIDYSSNQQHAKVKVYYLNPAPSLGRRRRKLRRKCNAHKA
jgi:hypothetical protein